MQDNDTPYAPGFMPYARYKEINRLCYPPSPVGDNRMSFDFGMSPKPMDTQAYALFIRYCQTSQHPNLRVEVNGPKKLKQTMITDYFSQQGSAR